MTNDITFFDGAKVEVTTKLVETLPGRLAAKVVYTFKGKSDDERTRVIIWKDKDEDFE